MDHISGFVPLSGGNLHYLQFGRGKKLLLAFHGYGNNASLFLPFGRYLADEFTILSFDLPHHGQSKWAENALLQRHDLDTLLQTLAAGFSVSGFSLMGYSMGGRVCLTIVEMQPARVERCLLIAPDGLVFNPLYYFVTRTFVGKRIFRRFLTEPGRYMNFIEWLRKKEYLDASRYRFAMYYLESERDRSFLLQVWPAMSRIIPDRKRLRAAIIQRHTPLFIFMGAYDRVIPAVHAERFRKGLGSVKLFVLEKGHRVFDSESMPVMANCLINGTC